MAEIQIQTVVKTYPGSTQPAVDAVSLHVQDGEFMVLLGPSGCGKTTLLRMLAGLDLPDSGQVTIGDADVTVLPPRQRQIAMVFQSYAIFPHLTVFENIAFGLRMRREATTAVQEKVARAAAMLQLDPYLARYPAQLSGGQRQRVAVARAIIMEPSVLLMDEPLSNLDALLRLTFRAELKTLVQSVGATTIYVTHDQVEALSLGNRIAVMRAGVIEQCASPMEVYDQPATEFVGSFIGNPPMNFVDAQVAQHNGTRHLVISGEHLVIPAGFALPPTPTVRLGIRAENITALSAPAPHTLPAHITVVEPLGSHVLLTVTLGSTPLKVVARTDYAAAPGQPVWLQLAPDKLRWFDPQTGARIHSA